MNKTQVLSEVLLFKMLNRLNNIIKTEIKEIATEVLYPFEMYQNNIGIEDKIANAINT